VVRIVYIKALLCCVAADIISTVEFNSTGELLATGDKGGRVVVFQREQEVRRNHEIISHHPFIPVKKKKKRCHSAGQSNLYFSYCVSKNHRVAPCNNFLWL